MKKTPLAEYLAEVCKVRDLSLRGLSVNAGLSPGTVHSIIFRDYEPSIYSLNQLADYLSVKRSFLWKLAGLIDEKELNSVEKAGDPRMNYYSEKILALPKPARELIINIIGDIIDYHTSVENSADPPSLAPVELKNNLST